MHFVTIEFINVRNERNQRAEGVKHAVSLFVVATTNTRMLELRLSAIITSVMVMVA